jgi:endonuclease/exonuclease/phosphatase family metal-dependent hydrolase
MVCVLTIFMNMEQFRDQPLAVSTVKKPEVSMKIVHPTPSVAPTVTTINGASFKGAIVNTSKTKPAIPKTQNFKKSSIWNAYLNYMKTGERINVSDAIKAWNKDAEMKQVIIQQPNVVSILSWNVKMWRWKPEEALKTLQKVNADVLCFQEYTRPPDAIAEYLKAYTFVEIDMISGFGNAIYSKKTMILGKKVTLRNINDINELQGGYEGEQRNMLITKLYLKLQPPVSVQLATTHLTVGEDERAVAIREYEATEILGLLNAENIILCGDFNSGIDSGEKVHKILSNKFEHMYDHNERTYSSTSIYGGTVDHFYYKSIYYINTTTQIVYSAGSDHFPVLFTILDASMTNPNAF